MSKVTMNGRVWVAFFDQAETIRSVYRQGGNLAPISWFSSAILVREGGQQFEGVNGWVAERMAMMFLDGLITE